MHVSCLQLEPLLWRTTSVRVHPPTARRALPRLTKVGSHALIAVTHVCRLTQLTFILIAEVIIILRVTRISSVVALCRPAKVNRHFGGKYRFHLQDSREPARGLLCLMHTGLLLGLLFDSEDGGDTLLGSVS
jgi:hypothetical protein